MRQLLHSMLPRVCTQWQLKRNTIGFNTASPLWLLYCLQLWTVSLSLPIGRMNERTFFCSVLYVKLYDYITCPSYTGWICDFNWQFIFLLFDFYGRESSWHECSWFLCSEQGVIVGIVRGLRLLSPYLQTCERISAKLQISQYCLHWSDSSIIIVSMKDDKFCGAMCCSL